MARPFFKFVGGKTKLLPELLARAPVTIDTYAEPFAGGAALFFALLEDPGRRVQKAVLADRNPDLIACYRAVRDDVDGLIGVLSKYKYDQDLYYEVRAQDPCNMNYVCRGARFLFLNKTCFNGLWRVNKDGKFNVPFGKYENPRIVDEEGLRAAAKTLSYVEIRDVDFAEVTGGLKSGDFAYLDPPYVPVSKTASFTSYAKDGFGPKDQQRLLDELRSLRVRGVHAMLSNADTVETRELYRGFAIHAVSAPRSINSDSKKRGNVGEIVVTTW